MKYTLRTRRQRLFAPLRCADCDKEIKIGTQYYNSGGAGEKNLCVDCGEKRKVEVI